LRACAAASTSASTDEPSGRTWAVASRWGVNAAPATPSRPDAIASRSVVWKSTSTRW
jgi:hypothetical protein